MPKTFNEFHFMLNIFSYGIESDEKTKFAWVVLDSFKYANFKGF